MGLKAADIRVEHHIVGDKHVFTSPDVPELYIAHADRDLAHASIQSALDVLANMKERLKMREAVQEVQRERIFG